jgi:soluble lytic murein transglycosylase-like protein
VTNAGRVAIVAGIVAALTPSPARAELVELTTGRVMSVTGVAYDGDRVTLYLRAGGEISCPATLIARVGPDEIPRLEAPPPETANVVRPSPERRPYERLIGAAARRYGLSPDLLHAVVRAESGYRPRARSHKGARGLMQLMPETLRHYGVSDPDDPEANIDAGARHLGRLLARYPLARALAAYNAGEGAIERHGGIPPFPETRAYVAGILAALPAAPPN